MSAASLFGSWLKQCRQERGLTQDALSEHVGCASQTIRKIEGGQRRPSFQMAERLAQVLELTPVDRSTWMHMARKEDTAPDLNQVVNSIHVAVPDLPQRAQLPLYFTPFIGRTQEQEDLNILLQDPQCRLVTVFGPGGCGKTRLAVEATRQCTAFHDGVAFVSLASIANASAVALSIGDALGLTFVPSQSHDLLDQLIMHLRDLHILLVLDNFEHLLDKQGSTIRLLQRLLIEAPQLSLLVTSRVRLRLSGEWVLKIDGLTVPAPDARLDTDSYTSLDLFVAHAKRIQHQFQLNTENEQAVASICRLVNGLPLGIELAAAWIRLLTPQDIVHELLHNLDTQHITASMLPARHHSLHAVINHSWQLLADDERAVLHQLAVFQGGFSREAAGIVAGADLRMLASIADKSLLGRAPDGSYHLHEIVRQYAVAHLMTNPSEYAATRTRHADYYMDWLAQRERPLLSGQQRQVEAEIVSEIDNVRAAWQWAVDQHMVNAIQRVGATLHWFYEFRGWYAEAVRMFGHAVQTLAELPAAQMRPEYQIAYEQLLGYYSYALSCTGMIVQGLAAAHQSRVILEARGDCGALTHSYTFQGKLAFQSGEYALAQNALEHTLASVSPDKISLMY